MYSIEYKTASGAVRLCGGSNPLLRPLSVSGLGLPEKDEATATFAFQPGQVLTGSRDKARDIQITGHVYCDYTRVARALRLLYTPGELIFRSDRGVKSIGARCIGVSDKKITETGAFYLELAFRCDNPYFKHPVEIVKNIYNREKRLQTTFTLPCVPSVRVKSGILLNDGDIAAEAVFLVENRSESVADGFVITNKTTGKSLKYTGKIPSGGKVILSVPDRTVTDEKGDDLLGNMQADSYLSDFALQKGENKLVFDCKTADVWCSCHYNVSFVEAIL